MEESLRQVELPLGFGQTRGSEHEVWLSANGDRVIKATHAGEFGRKFGPDRFATMPEYLDRIRLSVIEFGFDWRIEGTYGTGKGVRVVTSQPVFAGKPPARHALKTFLEDRGFRLYRTRFGDAWFRHEDSMLVSDAEPKNAVVTSAGIMAFDFLIAVPSPGLLAVAGIS
jgi:hypothetical protein